MTRASDTARLLGAGGTLANDVTISEGSPSIKLNDTDTSRFIDILYGTRNATFRNTMASGEDMDTVAPEIIFSTKDDGETREHFRMNKSEAVFNEGSVDLDFRVESNGDANMLFIDGGNDRLLVRKSDPTNADQAFHLGAGGDDHKMILQGNTVQRLGLQLGTDSRVFLGAATGNHFRVSKQDAGALFDVNPSGNIILGQSGAGIHLGVTSATASNLLHDYEEGTWSPTHTGGAGGGTLSDAKYTKIGRLVHIVFSITFNSGSGQMSVGNLPFTANSHSIGIGKEDNNNGYTVAGDLADNATVIDLLGTQSIGSPTAYQVGTGRIRFSMTYFTD